PSASASGCGPSDAQLPAGRTVAGSDGAAARSRGVSAGPVASRVLGSARLTRCGCWWRMAGFAEGRPPGAAANAAAGVRHAPTTVATTSMVMAPRNFTSRQDTASGWDGVGGQPTVVAPVVVPEVGRLGPPPPVGVA